MPGTLEARRVGDVVIATNGDAWVVTKTWEHRTHWDYLIKNQRTGDTGTLRVNKIDYA